jgi:hypothetical protein
LADIPAPDFTFSRDDGRGLTFEIQVISGPMRDKIVARHDRELINLAGSGRLIPLWET